MHTITGSTENNYPGIRMGLKHLLNPGPDFSLHKPGSLKRLELEQYISDQFNTTYTASICEYMPLLMAMSCQGKFRSAVGIRPASTRPLFLEQYLENTIEAELGLKTNQQVNRSSIVEIGNLSATHRGSSQLLLVILAAILDQGNYEWVVFTGTPQVQKIIRRFKVPLYTLCDADPARLVDSSLSEWGSYYDTQPKVIAFRLSDTRAIMKQHKVLMSMLALYKKQITALARSIQCHSHLNDKHSFAA